MDHGSGLLRPWHCPQGRVNVLEHGDLAGLHGHGYKVDPAFSNNVALSQKRPDTSANNTLLKKPVPACCHAVHARSDKVDPKTIGTPTLGPSV